MTEIHSGKLIAGRFRCRRRLANGGRVTIWNADDIHRSTGVVVKVPQISARSVGGFPAFNHRVAILRELTTGSTPPLVPTIYDKGTLETGRPYLVQSLVDGQLATELQCGDRHKALGRLCSRLCQFARGLHRHGLVHTDLRPQNIGTLDSGAYRVLDLGGVNERTRCADCGVYPAAGAGNQCSACGASLTDSAPQIDLPAMSFRPPELATTEVVGPWSDVYSIGRILEHVQANLWESTATLIPQSLLERATANPHERFQTPTDLLCAVESVRKSA